MLTATGPDKAFKPAKVEVNQKNGTVIAPALADPTCIYKIEADPALKIQSIRRDAKTWTFKVSP